MIWCSYSLSNPLYPPQLIGVESRARFHVLSDYADAKFPASDLESPECEPFRRAPAFP